MKKLFIVLALLAVVMNSSAKYKYKRGGSGGQFKIGIGGGFNSTWLFNTNVSNAGDELNYAATFGGQGGLSMAYDFTETMGIGMQVMYSMHNQKYEYLKGDFEFATRLSYIDIPILFRVGSMNQGAYFEVGPQIGILTGAMEDLTPKDPDDTTYSGKNVKSSFNGLDFAAVMGVGGSFDLSDNMVMSIGLRFGYSFTDATVEYTKEELEVLSLAKAPLSFTDVQAHVNLKGDLDYKPTNRAFGGILVTVMYKLP